MNLKGCKVCLLLKKVSKEILVKVIYPFSLIIVAIETLKYKAMRMIKRLNKRFNLKINSQ